MKRTASACRPGRGLVFACAGLLLLLLGSRASLAQDCVGFLEHTLDSPGTNGVVSVHAVDLDLDGDPDLLSASFNDDLIAWYENDLGTFEQHIISTDARGATSVFAADVDADGDVDVLSASAYDDKISWYENAGTTPPLFFERVLTRSARAATSVFAIDLDSDGDMDVLSASSADGEIAWYENLTESGVFSFTFDRHLIATDAFGAVSVHAGDLDGDNDADVVAAFALEPSFGQVVWYETVAQTEMDDEGMEVVVGYEFTARSIVGDPSADPPDYLDDPRSVHMADVDSDGDLDVLSASRGDDRVAWYENGPGTEINEEGEQVPIRVFTVHEIATDAGGAKSVFTGDFDGDQDIDVFVAAEDDGSVIWYENLLVPDGTPTFIAQIIRSGIESVDAVSAADVEPGPATGLFAAASGPGFVSRQDQILWFANDGALPPPLPMTPVVISGTSQGARSLVIADLDSDGFDDLVWAGGRDKIAWSKNEEDPGNPAARIFTEQAPSISATALGSSGVFVADLDSDGDPDVVSASAEDDKIAWYENGPGGAAAGIFGSEQIISTTADGAQAVFAADLDGDGLLDVLSASMNDNTIAWYRNGPAGTFTAQPVISAEAEAARSVFAADLDDDGDFDVISASSGDGKVAWYENRLNETLPQDDPVFLEHILAHNDAALSPFFAFGARLVDADDLDGDGDLDILSVSPIDNKVAWYVNPLNDGQDPLPPKSEWFTQQLLVTVNVPSTLSTADLDGDDDVDLIIASSAGDWVAWFENDGGTVPLFAGRFVGSAAANPATLATGDLGGDERIDIAVGYGFRLAWYEHQGEICDTFNVNPDPVDGDDRIDGVELAWLSKAFGRQVDDPADWWAPLDYNRDGIVDGKDLSILGSFGVWGMTVDTCFYSCQ